MPITGSGQIALIADIEAEFSQGDDNISLAQAGVDAGLDAGDLGMFEFYGLSDVALPSVGNAGVSSISPSSMVISGNVTNDGGGTVTQRGFYFGTSSTATNNSKYSVGSGTGGYSRTMTGLAGSTTYYYASYAINSAGETVSGVNSAATTQANVSSIISFSGCSVTASGYYNGTLCGSTSGFSVTNNSGGTVVMDAYASWNYNRIEGLQYYVYAAHLYGFSSLRNLLSHNSGEYNASLGNGYSDTFAVKIQYNEPSFAAYGTLSLYLTFARSGYATYYYQVFTGTL